MANENKNINELVEEDDDPTSELDASTIRQAWMEQGVDAEADAKTFDFDKVRDDVDDGVSVDELKSDLKARSETIERLQFDIQQLHAKWLGLEAEIQVREETTRDLNAEIKSIDRKLKRKDKLLAERDRTIKSLQSDAKDREKSLRELQALADRYLAEKAELENSNELGNARQLLSEYEGRIAAQDAELKELRSQQARTESYADEVRRKFASLDDNSRNAISERDELRKAIDEAEKRVDELKADAEAAAMALQDAQQSHEQELETLRSELHEAHNTLAEHEELRLAMEDAEKRIEALEADADTAAKALADAQQSHEQELKTLRFELGEAQDTLAERAELRQSFEDAQKRIEALEADADNAAKSLQDAQQSHEQELKALRSELDEAQNTLSDRDELQQALKDAEERVTALEADADAAAKALEDAQQSHEQELRTLRFEITEAEDTLSERDKLSEELAAELVDTRNTRIELEAMLDKIGDENRERIEQFESQIRSLESTVAEYEEKLAAKSDAINSLMKELARKNKEIESIGEMDDVIQDIDDRISERFVERPAQDSEPVTRLLVGLVDDREVRFPLFKDRLTIGRAQENDIQLQARFISRRHAVLQTEGDITRVLDWGSKNGVYVNSERVSEKILKNGDILTVGISKFRYEERPKREA